jgi:hypothetical protein
MWKLLQETGSDWGGLRDWILHDDPRTVNHLLTALCEKLEITPELKIKVVWRL